MNLGFVAAAVLSLITFGVHTFVGGKYAARPLLDATDFDRASRWLNYFTWHMATVLLLVMAAGYAWAAAAPSAWPAALILTIMAALFRPCASGSRSRAASSPGASRPHGSSP